MIDIDLDRVSIPLRWPELFNREAPTDVEIGSGKGKFLNEFATVHPERNILAIERSAKYHRLCCDRAARRGLTNVRLLRTTGEDLLFRLLDEASVANFYVLFPDPQTLGDGPGRGRDGDLGVPESVHDRLGHRLDVRVHLPAVQDQHVDIRAQRELPPSVPTRGEDRDPRVEPRGAEVVDVF